MACPRLRQGGSIPQLNFSKSGRGPVVVLSHALACTLGMWDDVVPLLEPHCTVLRYDHRGHGASEQPPGPYTIEVLADDAAALIHEQVGRPVHFVGLSLGGMVAQSLAARHPHLVSSLVLANTALCFDEPARMLWRDRIRTARDQGTRALIDVAMQRWFTPEFLAQTKGRQRAGQIRAMMEATDVQPYIATCQAMGAIDFRQTNPGIGSPALVLGGTRDMTLPLSAAEALRDSISGAEFAVLPTAHLSAVEEPQAFARTVLRFLRSV